MKKIIDILKKYKEQIIIIAVVIISLAPLYYPGYMYTHDGIIHLYRTAGAYENIINGDMFNRIYYNMIDGLGYGWGIFYPPLSAVIPALFMCLGFSLFVSEKLFILLASCLAGLFAYKLFKELFKNNFCAMLTTILYVLAPYKINQILIRGAMGEVLVFTFLPLVILGLIKILNGESKYKYYFIFGMCGIVYSHVISIVYTTIFAGILLVLNYKKTLKKQVIKDLIISSIIIILLSLPIIVPIVQNQLSKDYKISQITTDVADRVVHPGQLILSSFESKEVENTSYYSNDKEMNYMLGLSFIMIMLLIPYIIKKIKNSGNLGDFIRYIILLIITVLMMITPWIWNKISILDVIQYPWRILLFSVMFSSIICGYILKEIINTNNKHILFVYIVSFSMIFVFLIGINVKYAKTLNTDFNFMNQELSEKDDYGSLGFSLGYAHEYLPNNMTVNTIIEKQHIATVLKGDALISKQDTFENQTLTTYVDNNSNETIIELPLIYYEGYSIKIKNLNQNTWMNIEKYGMSENGFITVQLDENGQYEITAKYNGTPIYKYCDCIALVILVVYNGIIIYRKVKEVRINEKVK